MERLIYWNSLFCDVAHLQSFEQSSLNQAGAAVTMDITDQPRNSPK